MADSKRYEDWFNKANKDLNGAKILLQYDGGNDLVVFHCQQAIEKILKGHSLIYLCKFANKHGALLQDYLKDCAYVNQF